MGILSGLMTIVNVQRMKRGARAYLSISQITNLVVNMPDARKNLTTQEFESVYVCYKLLRTQKSKTQMDIIGYYETAIRIILVFDDCAPYEKYCGSNEFKASLMMEEIRGLGIEDIPEYALKRYVADELRV